MPAWSIDGNGHRICRRWGRGEMARQMTPIVPLLLTDGALSEWASTVRGR